MITVNGTGTYPGMITAFFEWSTGSYPSTTQIAASLQGTSNALNTSSAATGTGTTYLSIQQNGNTGQVQIKSSTAMTITYNITLL